MAKRSQVKTLIVAARLLAADAVRALIAAPGVGSRLRIYKVSWNVRIAAAQIVDVGEAAGAASLQAFSIAASSAGSGTIEFDDGFPLTENTAFSADPVAAGPEIQFVIEYIIEPKTSVTA